MKRNLASKAKGTNRNRNFADVQNFKRRWSVQVGHLEPPLFHSEKVRGKQEIITISANSLPKKKSNSSLQLKCSFSCKFLMCSRKPDLHTFGGKGEESLKLWLLSCSTIQKTSFSSHRQKISRMRFARLGCNPNLGEGLLFYKVWSFKKKADSRAAAYMKKSCFLNMSLTFW